MMRVVALLIAICWHISPAIAQSNFCQQIDGAVIISASGDYLGKFANQYDSNSIFNKFGTYGSKFQSKSIWNDFGENGSEYNPNSWRNKFSPTPPKVIKNGSVIAFLTVNKNVAGAINPIVVGAMCYEFDPE